MGSMPNTTSNDVISDDASLDDKYEADFSDIDGLFLYFEDSVFVLQVFCCFELDYFL